MTQIRRAPAERFAAATDALIAGDGAWAVLHDAPPEELALAVRLRTTAGCTRPDPGFVDGLRQELRARVVAATQPAASAVRYATIDTPVGLLGVAYRDGRVVFCTRFETAAAFERSVAAVLGVVPGRDAEAPPKIARGIRDHMEGRRSFTAVDLSWLPPFQQKVLQKIVEIPRGEVRPYAWVAREIGAPGAVRAVGTALGHNPIPIFVPCHRVVRSDGTLGEYSLGGPAVKEQVLAFEGAPVEALLAGARRGERFRGSRTTHIVCYPSCHAARRIRPENAAPFATLAQARQSGYRACTLCRPA
jgi:O-6-methylguanine DNA methyltransferase